MLTLQPAIASRSSFGFYFARFAVVVRMITALFWHAIQTYTGSTAMTQCIRAIWPSYLDIPNHIPAAVGITTQEMISHFIFWSVQFPFLLTPPHKLKWFFIFKAIVVIITSVAVVIYMTTIAGGTGKIWDQPYEVHGSDRSWLILSEHDVGRWRLGHNGNERARLHQVHGQIARCILARVLSATHLASHRTIWHHLHKLGESGVWRIHLGSVGIGCSVGWSRRTLWSLLRRLLLVRRADRY